MRTKLSFPLLVAVLFLAWPLAGFGAPKPANKGDAERDKVIKVFVAKVVVAVGKQDIDALVALSEVPFNHQRGSAGTPGIQTEKDDLKSVFRGGLQGKPKFEGKHEVKTIQTYKTAKTRFDEQEIKDAKGVVLGDDDIVVDLEVDYPDQKQQWRLLIKMKDGKPRLVGLG